MNLPVSINTLGALITLGLGIFGLFWPHSAAELVSIRPEGERGVSEIRATYGGIFLAIGIFAIVAQSPDIFRVVGVGWIGAAGARSFYYVRDNSRSGANLLSIAIEAAGGVSMLLPWDTFFGS